MIERGDLLTSVLQVYYHHAIECFALDIACRTPRLGGSFGLGNGGGSSSGVTIDITLGKYKWQASKGRGDNRGGTHLVGSYWMIELSNLDLVATGFK